VGKSEIDAGEQRSELRRSIAPGRRLDVERNERVPPFRFSRRPEGEIRVAGDCTYGFMCMQPDFPYEPEWVAFRGGDIVEASGR
ncbi:MAG TPA: hypothetical protein VFQ80_08310, partial [Thermomicrobiales bacterium]|nr:hypothetical protein [Thermomicrobiales bacterium]